MHGDRNGRETRAARRKSIKENIMQGLKKLAIGGLIAGALAPVGATAQAPVKIGVVAFLSGPAAAPFGVPAKNAADFVIDELNAGKAPAPYGKTGFGGSRIETVVVDEAGSSTTQVTEFRNLVQRHNVDLVIGYISSGNCLAIAPVAEELKKFTDFFDCGTPRIFEDASYKYVFRTSSTATMDSVGAALFVKNAKRGIKSIAGVKAAWEKALVANGGKRPSNEQVGAALERMTFEGPGGVVRMAIGKGHQAVTETAYGITKLVGGKLTVTNVQRYPAETVNPPDGMTSADWIKRGFKK